MCPANSITDLDLQHLDCGGALHRARFCSNFEQPYLPDLVPHTESTPISGEIEQNYHASAFQLMHVDNYHRNTLRKPPFFACSSLKLTLLMAAVRFLYAAAIPYVFHIIGYVFYNFPHLPFVPISPLHQEAHSARPRPIKNNPIQENDHQPRRRPHFQEP